MGIPEGVIARATHLSRYRLLVAQTRGASSVEFALVAGLLFAIIFATIEFGVWGVNQSVVAGAARDAAVQFAQTESAAQGTKKALSSATALSTPLLSSEVKFYIGTSTTAASSTATCTPGQLITAKISHPYVPILASSLTSILKTAAMNISSESAAVCE